MTLPKQWLIHSITYEEYKGVNDWDSEEYTNPIDIKHVRFDDSSVFSRDSDQNKILADAIIFVDAKHSKPIKNFKERSKITFNDKDYVLKKVVPCYYPTKNKIRHYELEVI